MIRKEMVFVFLKSIICKDYLKILYTWVSTFLTKLVNVSVHRLPEQRVDHRADRGQAVHQEVGRRQQGGPDHEGHAQIRQRGLFEVILAKNSWKGGPS